MIHVPCHLQKATKFIPTKHADKLEGCFIEQKIDGQSIQTIFNNDIRLYANSPAKKSGVFTDYTDNVPHIVNELKIINDTLSNLGFDGLHLQGEIYSDHLQTEKLNFNYTVGVLKDHHSYERQCKEGLTKYIVYDIPSAGNLSYKERYEILQSLFRGHSFQYISLIPILGINTNDSWIDYYNDIVDQGKEGVVLYEPSAPYKFSENSNGHNPSIWKIKGNGDREVCVIEKIRGKAGKYENTMGVAIAVDGNGKRARIGSFSLTDEERDYIWTNVECPFIAEMQYMSEGPTTYRHARMVRYRPDKSVDDWNPE